MKVDKKLAGRATLNSLPGRRTITGLLLLMISAFLLAACAVDPGQGDLAPTAETAPAVETTAPAVSPTAGPTDSAPDTQALPPTPAKAEPTRALPGGLETVPPTAGTPVVGEVPDDLMERILDDLAGRLGVDPQSIQVVQAEAVLWNDGSLGCPDPGEVYTQAQVEGYHIVLQVGDQIYDYRANEGSYFFLCEQGVR